MTGEPEDAELARRALANDRSAFVTLYDRHAPAVARFARTFGAPLGEVDDLVQDVFLSAWRRLADYDGDRPFRGWLFRITVNRVRDTFRRRQVRDFFFGAGDLDASSLQVPSHAPSPETIAHDRVALSRLAAAVAQLPDDLRTALVLTAVSGLTYPEAAVALGVSVKALEGRVARARQRLDRASAGFDENKPGAREGGGRSAA